MEDVSGADGGVAFDDDVADESAGWAKGHMGAHDTECTHFNVRGEAGVGINYGM
jgi:hypothetical protein